MGVLSCLLNQTLPDTLSIPMRTDSASRLHLDGIYVILLRTLGSFLSGGCGSCRGRCCCDCGCWGRLWHFILLIRRNNPLNLFLLLPQNPISHPLTLLNLILQVHNILGTVFCPWKKELIPGHHLLKPNLKIPHLICTKRIPFIAFSISRTDPIDGGWMWIGGSPVVSFPFE